MAAYLRGHGYEGDTLTAMLKQLGIDPDHKPTPYETWMRSHAHATTASPTVVTPTIGHNWPEQSEVPTPSAFTIHHQ